MQIFLRNHTLLQIILLVILGITTSSIYNPGNAQSEEKAMSESKPVALIFDLGGVLIDTNYLYTLWYLGIPSLIAYGFHNALQNNNQVFSLKKKMYTLLNQINGISGNLGDVRDDEGTLIPQLLCDWLSSIQKNQELLNDILKKIAEHPTWFGSSNEQVLISRMIRMILTPEYFIASRILNAEGIEFIKACKNQGFKLYILSNWDVESFNYLVQKNQDFFNLFDDIIISGITHTLKPSPVMYQDFINNKEYHWVVIDDQEENIISAQQLGFQTIHCKRKNGMFFSTADFTDLRKQLDTIEKKIK